MRAQQGESSLLSVSVAHAPEDTPFAQELIAFLESGCDAVRFAPDAIRPGWDLLSTVELGHASDVVVVLLSAASSPSNWPRPDRWEPLLRPDSRNTNVRVAIFLLDAECKFPALLRRGSGFFDATGLASPRLSAMRHLKRWLRGVQSGTAPAMHFSPDLENLYHLLADQTGTATLAGATAARFAREAARDFNAVLWIPSHGRTLAQIAGELGSSLQMTLDGEIHDNCRRIRTMLSGKRCLLVFDAPQVAVDALLPSGRTSVLFTADPVHTAKDSTTLAAARSLVSQRRFAEAYELFHTLLNSGVEPESCARELIWICEHWDRLEEANALRFQLGPSPSEQLRLF